MGTTNKLSRVIAAMPAHLARVARIRTSARGVPHLVVETMTGSASIAWFWRDKTYTVFFPWPSLGEKQKAYRGLDRPAAVVQKIEEFVA